MGSSASRPSPLALTFERMASWDIKAAKRLLSEYKEKDLDFGLDAQSLAEICGNDLAWANAIIDAFGGTNGIVNALAFICGAILISSGAALEKAGLVFEALDFDLTEQISMDEMTILFLCCARGYCVMASTGAVPSDEALENVTLQAYRALSKSSGHSITKTEFTNWVLQFVAAAPTAVPHAEVSLEDMAMQFGLVAMPATKSMVEQVLQELEVENNAVLSEEPNKTEPEELKDVEAFLHEDKQEEEVEEVRDAEETIALALAEAPIQADQDHGIEPAATDEIGDEFQPETAREEVGDMAGHTESADSDFVGDLQPQEGIAQPSESEAVPATEEKDFSDDLNAFDTYDYADAAYDGSSGLAPPDPFDTDDPLEPLDAADKPPQDETGTYQ